MGKGRDRGRGCLAGVPSRLSQTLFPLTPSFLLCSQGNKVPAGPALDASGDSGASDEWVFDKKVSEAEGGSFALSHFLPMWYPPSGEVSVKVPHRAGVVLLPLVGSPRGPHAPDRHTFTPSALPGSPPDWGRSLALVFLSWP